MFWPLIASVPGAVNRNPLARLTLTVTFTLPEHDQHSRHRKQMPGSLTASAQLTVSEGVKDGSVGTRIFNWLTWLSGKPRVWGFSCRNFSLRPCETLRVTGPGFCSELLLLQW